MKIYGLLGEKLSHSISPEIHSFVYKLLNLEAKYNIYEIHRNDLPNFMKNINDKNGINVTIPYKEDIINYLDNLDDMSTNINSVNTIFINGGEKNGFNTDYYGIEKTLNKSKVNANSHLVLGFGGSSKTLIEYLINNGADKIYVASRNPKKHNKYYENREYFFSKITFIDYDEIKKIRGYYIINTTPIGMHPNVDNIAVDTDVFDNFQVAFDLIYNPYTTKFLETAKSKGLEVQNGLKMLVYQALRSIEIWNRNTVYDNIYDIDEDIKKCIYVYFKNKYSAINDLTDKNIYLVGITGCGKTSIAKILAEILNYEYIDTDEYIEKLTSKSISEVFLKGEKYFRDIESKILQLVSESDKKPKIISTGGGIVTQKRNLEILRGKNVIYIDRDCNNIIDTLNTLNRPLLKSNPNKLFELFEKRKHLYEKISSYTVDNNKDIKDAVNSILEYLKNRRDES